MKRYLLLGLSLAVAGIVVFRHYLSPPSSRSASLETLRILQMALASPDTRNLLRQLALPTAFSGRSETEQGEFVRKALADELSEAGLAALQREGRFGSLAEIFPLDGVRWAQQAGVANAKLCSVASAWYRSGRADGVEGGNFGSRRSKLSDRAPLR